MYTNFKSFWGGDVFGSVKWYGMPRVYVELKCMLKYE